VQSYLGAKQGCGGDDVFVDKETGRGWRTVQLVDVSGVCETRIRVPQLSWVLLLSRSAQVGLHGSFFVQESGSSGL
jgi:hypothetical protein